MVKMIAGNLEASKLKFCLVVSRFNEMISKGLVGGAEDCLKRHGVKDENVTIVWVPGAFEMPLIAQKLAKNYDAVICLGAVVRGGTPHFEYVASEAAKGIAQVSLQTGVPVIFGVLTTDSLEQALERSGVKSNKGFAAAQAAIEMANLGKEI
ncbi:6,7-dimethyl-8-ribityllumazine synthase [candidate division WOR-1 bacterium RIFOXYA12_FULL_52_29]|uniref:6,7-dimethyl-8-ribityllumazine synthase n=1 Tax=candidate division WOR-1 bacterium RIFOXYC12_FULL_54_18 TaxID=1802584 RepID=A0A1F4T4P8_UNCSA|nr:MAG: 6,7-dimethyl-8-ribityllumazine synthase [candidate division WOR-1 bacterium RIFOXYA2_FULL_51_19]OGC17119.1 MAG: 6,7-dimethyl-8-ribityllumazine synthase [candidate division WOR-1 bacterium RIFOXYA12_FULL_52_29]OGC25979.1 MAG: 6,7-dimethyl-8-ribityllumazine synthase [candidate division WOR-1 bacterium RIFOXYB2_FULL_45_9]OGC27536.1 MAG: 6,7-dimethyl-8-ribityllumazine synthase [candidate division WOR-1 bacterium RIFOXYC12_FULL_54_18]OGC29251.1 MAG: 6,7-dimethyl-8-ribityllumazine synthase [c